MRWSARRSLARAATSGLHVLGVVSNVAGMNEIWTLWRRCASRSASLRLSLLPLVEAPTPIVDDDGWHRAILLAVVEAPALVVSDDGG